MDAIGVDDVARRVMAALEARSGELARP